MRKLAPALAALCLLLLVAAPTDARKRHNHKPAGVKGVVLNRTCPGPCVDPAAQPQPYTGPVTVSVTRASDGRQVTAQAITDGRFRIRLGRGLYDVSSIPPSPPTCEPQPQAQQICPPPCTPTKEVVCPLVKAPEVIVAPCLTGETKRVQVRRHRFTYLELHVNNVCVV